MKKILIRALILLVIIFVIAISLAIGFSINRNIAIKKYVAAKIDSNIPSNDFIEISGYFPERIIDSYHFRILTMVFVDGSCKSKYAGVAWLTTFESCNDGDVIVDYGWKVESGGCSTPSLLRKVNGKWEIIDKLIITSCAIS